MKISETKSCVWIKRGRSKKCRFYGVTWFITWFFERKQISDTFETVYFKNWHNVYIYFKIWCTVKLPIQNQVFWRGTTNAFHRFHGVTYLKKWVFECNFFFSFRNNLFFQIQIWNFVKLLVQNLPHFKILQRKIWLLMNFLNLITRRCKISFKFMRFEKKRKNEKQNAFTGHHGS